VNTSYQMAVDEFGSKRQAQTRCEEIFDAAAKERGRNNLFFCRRRI